MAIHFILIVGHEEETKNYTNAASFAGYFPIVTDTLDLLNQDAMENTFTNSLLSLADVLILPGGSDISPSILGAANQGSRQIDEPLDLVQLAYFQYFLRHKKPIIGICKGLQLINVALGGSLIQNMSPDRLLLHQALDGKDNQHSCNYEFNPDIPLNSYIFHNQAPNYINSAHHQCVQKLAPDLYAFQHASDGTIEGFIHNKLPILGLQWHPERKKCFSGNYLKIYLYRMIQYNYSNL